VPISFIAARNLMKDVRSPLASVALSILGWPLGIWLGLQAANWMGSLSGKISANLGTHIAGAVLSPVVAWAMLRWALNQPEGDRVSLAARLGRYLALVLVTLPASLALFQLSSLSVKASQALQPKIGGLGFLANFVTQSGDVVLLLSPLIIALIIGAALSSLLSRLGQSINEGLPEGSLKGVNLLLAALAGAALAGIIGMGLNWLYEFNDPLKVIYLPAAVGALGGIFVALRSPAKGSLPMGLSIYYVTRTLLNAVRSVEALVMAIVAVIWVGIGPFAGTLALALHTVASLAKLYSEQVESIAAGPIEAIQATGANRLQTIIYAVVPQIIPPYISFTMYRWDINVRMSTIIGFAGGGGIGFLLQQNINLVNYRAASTQMVAIAIVVATMDYLSSTLREKYV
jgi:phosphonate ABC transporter permease subunit PhnE